MVIAIIIGGIFAAAVLLCVGITIFIRARHKKNMNEKKHAVIEMAREATMGSSRIKRQETEIKNKKTEIKRQKTLFK